MLDVVVDDIQKHFYDPTLKGLDWDVLVRKTRARIKGSESRSEMFTAISALVDRLQDSHTIFLPPARVGTVLFGFDAMPVGEEIRVYKFKKGGAAEKVGLTVGDRILAVNGYGAERRSFDQMMLYFRVLSPAPVLRLAYSRSGGPPQEVAVEGVIQERNAITDWTVYGLNRLRQEAAQWQSEQEKAHSEMLEGDVGLVRLPTFASGLYDPDATVGRIRKARALIVDLRRNPGGELDTLRRFMGFFEDAPVVILESQSRKKTEPLKAEPRAPHLTVPMFILVDSESSSAAEIFARHFQSAGVRWSSETEVLDGSTLGESFPTS
jgi:C-terminal processing protease CtpA/Prc